MNRVPNGLEDLFDTLRAQGWNDADIYASLNIPYSANAQSAKARFNNFANKTGGASAAGGAATAGAGVGKTKGKLFKQDGFFGKGSGKFSNFAANVANPQFDWTKESGIQGWGKNLGKAYNFGNMAIQGYNAARGLQGISDSRDRARDLTADIVLGASNSPTIQYDLNADQRALLRELQRGSYDTKVDFNDIDLLGAIGDTFTGALAGLPGGVTGAVIGGIGGLANSVIGDFGGAADRDAAELEALYQAILESEQYHNQMRKQRAYAGLY